MDHMSVFRRGSMKNKVVVAMMVGVGVCIVMGKKYSLKVDGWSPKKVLEERLLLRNKPYHTYYNKKLISINASTPEILKYWGYPAESHEVITEDGYILTLHRIPHREESRRGVVLLQHGLLCSSSDWVINPPHEALGYALADEGYDVWMGNVRGNTYSKKHIKLRNNDPAFWDFSWDEMGDLDLPAEIDYILKETQEKALFYIGHSMGTTAFWVMMNKHPEYNNKILTMFALAPVAYVGHMSSPVLRMMAPFSKEIDEFAQKFGHGEFLSNDQSMKLFAKFGCDLNRIEERLCEKLIFIFGGGPNPKNFNTSMIPWILGHTPAGTSSHAVLHYGQEVLSKRFHAFDYGKAGNYKHYNQTTPPEYDLSKVTAPVVVFWGENDWLADPQDVEKTLKELGNVIKSEKVKDAKFNHLDFLYGMDTRKLVYEPLISYMNALVL